MNKETIDKIQRLGTKYDIKEANGTDGSKELHEMLTTLGSTIDNSDGHVYAFIAKTEALAKTLINEPLSDIPMGRIMQLIPIMEREYECFKDICNKYMNGDKDISASMIREQFDRFYAISEFTATSFRNLGDHKTIMWPEFTELNKNEPDVINLAKIKANDMDTLLVAFENWTHVYDNLIIAMKNVFESKDMEHFNSVFFVIGVENVYAGDIVRLLELW